MYGYAMTETFGQLVRQRREALGIKLRAFATQMHVDPSTITRLETDENYEPSRDLFYRIIDALGIEETVALAGLGYYRRGFDALAERLYPSIREAPVEFRTADPDLWAEAVRQYGSEDEAEAQLVRLLGDRLRQRRPVS